MTFKLNPQKAVSFKESAIRKVLKTSMSLMANIKYDGIRCLMVVEPCEPINGKQAAIMKAVSRTDKLIPSLTSLFMTDNEKVILGQLLAESNYPEGFVIDGEMMVKNVPFEASSGILRRKKQVETKDLQYMVYGYLPLADLKEDANKEVPISNCVMYMQCEVLLCQLRELLPAIDWQLAENYDLFHYEDIETLYNEKRDQGYEGLVLKDPMANYKRGKKVGFWKVKPENTIDGYVMAVNWGTEGLANEGKVIGFEVLLEDGTVVNANGITQTQMNEFTQAINIFGETYFEAWQCEVSYMERTSKGGLRHPNFLCWRGLEGSETIKA